MAQKNRNLHTAKSVKNDEFYTRFEDISKEVTHYKEFFKDKVVYCNRDRVDGDNRSNFFVYFATYFEILGLKRLISLIEKRNVANDEIKKYALKSLTELGNEGFIMVRQNKKKELCFVYHPLKTSLPNLGNVIIECNEI